MNWLSLSNTGRNQFDGSGDGCESKCASRARNKLYPDWHRQQWRNAVRGHSAALGPVTLPPDCDNQPYVQLRWKYYWVSGANNSRDQLRLDDIVVTDQIPPAPGPSQLTPQPGGGYALEFTGQPGLPYSVESSTNLVQWTLTGAVIASPTGLGVFTVSPATNELARFLRVRWP